MRSTFDAKRASTPFISFLMLFIRVLTFVIFVLIECFVVADRLEVEDVVLPSSDVFAFLACPVAISVGGARFD